LIGHKYLSSPGTTGGIQTAGTLPPQANETTDYWSNPLEIREIDWPNRSKYSGKEGRAPGHDSLRPVPEVEHLWA